MSEDKPKKRGFFTRLFGRDESAIEPEKQPVPETVEEPAEPETTSDLDLEAETLCPNLSPHSLRAEPEPEPEPVTEEKRGFFKLQTGLTKTRSKFLQSLDGVFLGKRQIDDQMLGRLEEMLVTADIGVKTAYRILEG